jgi:sugar/nucleoside kinase (ribokinase family)
MGPSSLELCFGDLQRLPEPGEELFCHELAIRPRQAALIAITARRLGVETSLRSPLARDFPGRYLEKLLAAEGVVWQGPSSGSSSGMRVDFGLTCETAVQVSPARVADARSTSRPSVLAVPLSWLDAAPDGVELCVLADGMRLSDKVDHRGIALLLTTPATATAASGEADIQAALRGLAKHADTVIIDMGTDGAIAACDGMIERIDEAPRSRHASDIAHQLFCGAYLWAYVRGLKPTERLRWAMLHASRGDVP